MVLLKVESSTLNYSNGLFYLVNKDLYAGEFNEY